MKLILLGIGSLTVTFLTFSSCHVVEGVVYEHEPTQKLEDSWKDRTYKSDDFLSEELSPFRSGGILFLARTRNVDRFDPRYSVTLHLVAQTPGRTVLVHRARIGGDGWTLENVLDVEAALRSGGGPETRYLYSTGAEYVELFEIDLEDDGPLYLVVDYSIDGSPGTMSFVLVRDIEKGYALPT